YFNPPLLKFGDAKAISRLEAEGERRFPIDVAQVNSPSVWRSSLEVELPEGWKADVPADVTVDGAFGYYHASYKHVGRILRATRHAAAVGGRIPQRGRSTTHRRAALSDRPAGVLRGVSQRAGPGAGVTQGRQGDRPERDRRPCRGLDVRARDAARHIRSRAPD